MSKGSSADSTYSTDSMGKNVPAPAYGAQAAGAFGLANEKGGNSPMFLGRTISVSKPEEAHAHSAPRVTFNTRRSSPHFESSGNAV